ncbi:uncharacterized protein EURHEDRAFT_416126 [Aspergillus ruber CBS 135680]|uniref:Uncharacterized protein n=1 Tax=Aspergillus ruber (strain CBS 135680) TaxID=1388766 RepID=A0A017S488_ASPRC|nr:uncharacterized protein EURHEDRAFT_416126 [Aspergillus ruber CBS 135680]EYE91848.1 hypothetical protein EURHEDRAFT_416126 [Aspergillus ruber CBS 135680]
MGVRFVGGTGLYRIMNIILCLICLKLVPPLCLFPDLSSKLLPPHPANSSRTPGPSHRRFADLHLPNVPNARLA